jgi:pimeloyl-ACP methyl ester carboxylesterase
MEALGVAPGDLILAANGHAVQDWPGLRSVLMGLYEGDAITVKAWRRAGRKGKDLEFKGKVVGAPLEQGTARYDVLYDEAPFEGGWLRTIAMIPRSDGPHPIVYFLPGYSCFSIDNLSVNDPYHKLFDSLANLGNIIYRVEKPGMGDGPSPCSCETTGFDKELSAFEAGYDRLLKYEWADEGRIFLVGHSMGGVEAPLLATRNGRNPKGIAVYGTVFQTWYEYVLMMLRFQEPRTGEDYLTFEDDMRNYVQLFYAHYVEMKPLAAVIANPEWKALLERDFALDAEGNILFRRAEYWQEICRHSLTRAWAETKAHVLSMFGEADFEVFDSFSMSEIARIVNRYHPGHGKFVSLPGTDHGMINVGSMEKGLELHGTPGYRDYYLHHFNARIVSEIDGWIRSVMEAG